MGRVQRPWEHQQFPVWASRPQFQGLRRQFLEEQTAREATVILIAVPEWPHHHSWEGCSRAVCPS